MHTVAFPSTALFTLGVSAEPLAPPSIPEYAELELVGRGGMGRVYRARHIALGRIVAIKVLAHEPEDRLLARFAEEARAVAKLQHPNIGALFETGTVDGRPWFAQEYLPGGSLAAKIGGVPQNPRLAAMWLATLSEAMEFCHGRGILHRDLKPGNILFAADGTPKITDFGLAKEISVPGAETPKELGTAITRTGEIVGTPGYMPPEQASGVVSSLGAPADVYALGAILYESITGRPPFQAPDPLQTVLQVLTMDPVSPRVLQPGLPRDIETICLKCLEKLPKKRYPSAGELAADLHRFLDGRPIVARPVGSIERGFKWARRNRAGAALIAAGVVLVFVILGFSIEQSLAAERERHINTNLKMAQTDLEQKNADLLAAKTESDRSYGLAVEALRTVVERLAQQLFGQPLVEGALLTATADSAELYGKLAAIRPDDRDLAIRYVRALVLKSSQDRAFGRRDNSEKSWHRAAGILAPWYAAEPNEPELISVKLRLDLERIDALTIWNQTADLDRLRREWVALVRTYGERRTVHIDRAEFRILSHWMEAALAGDADEGQTRIEFYRKATAEAEAHSAKYPDHEPAFIYQHTSLSLLGGAQERVGNIPAAAEIYERLEKLLASRMAAEPNRFQWKSDWVDAVEARAGVAAQLGDVPGAGRMCRTAEPLRRELARLFPLDANRSYSLANNLVWQAILERTPDRDAAKQHIAEATEISAKIVKEHPANDLYAKQDAKWKAIRSKIDGGS